MHIGGRAALEAAQRRVGRAVRKPAFGVAIITPLILAGAVGASAPTPLAPVRDSAVTPLAAVQPSPGNRNGASVVAVTKTPTAFHIAAATVSAMLLLAAFALTNIFVLARRLAGVGVAVATTIATAVYPIFFVQSSLTHADLMAAACTLWGIRLYVERRIWPSQLAFCLAVLSKETAVITPLALALWELFQAEDESGRSRLTRSAVALVPVSPLLLWLLYHHHATGRFFGNSDFYQYNVTQALNPLRFLLAMGQKKMTASTTIAPATTHTA